MTNAKTEDWFDAFPAKMAVTEHGKMMLDAGWRIANTGGGVSVGKRLPKAIMQPTFGFPTKTAIWVTRLTRLTSSVFMRQMGNPS